jgi:hypothetical protein
MFLGVFSPLKIGVILGTRQNMGHSFAFEKNDPCLPLPEMPSCLSKITTRSKYTHAL